MVTLQRQSQRVKLATGEQLLKAYYAIFWKANWEFSKVREVETARMLDGKKITMGDLELEVISKPYEFEVIKFLKRTKCRKRTEAEMKRCISTFIKRHRLADIEVEIRGRKNKGIYRLTFVELGVSDRYYYKHPAVVLYSPAGIIRSILNGRQPRVLKPLEGDIVFDEEIAREYIKVMRRYGKFNAGNYKPRKSKTPRIEYEKILHFLKPVPDLKKRVYGGVPVYFGYVFSDDVVLFMNFPEIKEVGEVVEEVVHSYDKLVKSKNIIVEARNMKPIEILAIERLFNIVVNVTDTDGKAEINHKNNSYRINWVARVNWRTGKLEKKVKVDKKPPDIDKFYLLVKNIATTLYNAELK